MKIIHRQTLNLFALATMCSGSAAANLLLNPSFESPGASFSGASLPAGSNMILVWTTTNAEIAYLTNSNTLGISTPFGSAFLDLTGYHDASPYGGVTQSVNLTAGNYILTFYLGEYQSDARFQGPVAATASAGNQSNVLFTTTAPAFVSGNIWQQQTLNFSVAAAGAVPITVVGAGTSGGGYIGLDNFDLEPGAATAAPEPSTIGTVVLAGLALIAGRRRFQRQA
jgi:hypothetical protein